MDKLKAKLGGDVSPTAAKTPTNLDSANIFSLGENGAPEFNTGNLAEAGAKKLFQYGLNKLNSISGNVTPKANGNRANLDSENIFGAPDNSDVSPRN